MDGIPAPVGVEAGCGEEILLRGIEGRSPGETSGPEFWERHLEESGTGTRPLGASGKHLGEI